jgi:integrase
LIDTPPSRLFVSQLVSKCEVRMVDTEEAKPSKGAEKLPTTDKGWQAWLQNYRQSGERRYLSLGGGLAINIGAGGDRLFQARIRLPGAKNATREPLGYFPATSVADARRRLSEVRAEVKEGRDPALARKRARERVEEVATFGALTDRYLARRADCGLRHTTLAVETQALAPIRAALGDRLLSDLEPRDFAAVIEREAKRLREGGGSGRQANIALAAVKRAFKHARRAGDYMGLSPVAELGRPVKDRVRERVLYDGRVIIDDMDPERNELGALATALREDDGLFRTRQETRTAITLSLLLGLRVSEAAALQWTAVRLDDDLPTLRVLFGKTKSATRTLPLPPQAVALLRALQAGAAAGGLYVFPAQRSNGRAPHLHPESVSRALARIFEKIGIEGAVEHDLRRTCLSGIIESTGDEAIAERIAGHKSKTTLGKHYDQARRYAAMRDALTAWADAVDDAARRAGHDGR